MLLLYLAYRGLVTGVAGIELEVDREKHPRLFKLVTAVLLLTAALFFGMAAGLE